MGDVPKVNLFSNHYSLNSKMVSVKRITSHNIYAIHAIIEKIKDENLIFLE